MKYLKDGSIVNLKLFNTRRQNELTIYEYAEWINGLPCIIHTFKYNLDKKLKYCQSIFTDGNKWEKYNG